MRSALYLPAVVALTYNPAVKPQAERLKARGNKSKQTVCAAMRKLLTITYGLLKSGKLFDPVLAIAH